jgi:hypothetical protein
MISARLLPRAERWVFGPQEHPRFALERGGAALLPQNCAIIAVILRKSAYLNLRAHICGLDSQGRPGVRISATTPRAPIFRRTVAMSLGAAPRANVLPARVFSTSYPLRMALMRV